MNSKTERTSTEEPSQNGKDTEAKLAKKWIYAVGLLLSFVLFWLVVLSYSEGSGYVFSNLPVASESSFE